MPERSLKTFTSFDGDKIAYHDQGEGPAVMLPHGGFVDRLGQFGEYDYILPLVEKLTKAVHDVQS